MEMGAWGGGRRVSGMWCRKFYDPHVWKNKFKIVNAVEQKGSRMKQFRKPERRDFDESLCKCFKQPEVTFYVLFFYVRGAVHRNSVSINIQQDATIYSLFYL